VLLLILLNKTPILAQNQRAQIRGASPSSKEMAHWRGRMALGRLRCPIPPQKMFTSMPRVSLCGRTACAIGSIGCKSQPIIRMSASFGPSAVRVTPKQFTRAVARPRYVITFEFLWSEIVLDQSLLTVTLNLNNLD